MPQSDSQVETTEQVPDDRAAVRAAAEAEERHAAELIQQANSQDVQPAKQEDESLVAVMAQGREHLLQRMREHAAVEAAKKEAYVPPPMTDRQREKLEAEQEAGRKARERHEAQQASRPPPPREKWDGTNTPVMRPGSVVPDPMVPAAGGYAAGNRQYGADA